MSFEPLIFIQVELLQRRQLRADRSASGVCLFSEASPVLSATSSEFSLLDVPSNLLSSMESFLHSLGGAPAAVEFGLHGAAAVCAPARGARNRLASAVGVL